MNPGGRSVLVVDDEKEMCWVLEHVLSRSGYANDVETSNLRLPEEANAFVLVMVVWYVTCRGWLLVSECRPGRDLV